MPPLQHQTGGAAKVKNEDELIITIYYVMEKGKVSEIQVRQDQLLSNPRVTIPYVVDFGEGEWRPRYDFQDMVGTGSQAYLDALWDAFQSFVNWISSETYTKPRIDGSNIDAYILGEIFESPAFANAVMLNIMNEELPKRKYDVDLEDSFRQIFNECSSRSPLRRLYFDTAVYWDLSFGSGCREARHHPYGQRKLGLDPFQDKALSMALRRHRLRFCACQSDCAKSSSLHQDHDKEEDILETKCRCQCAPWDKGIRDRYFLEV